MAATIKPINAQVVDNLIKENTRLRLLNRELLRQKQEFAEAMSEWCASEDGVEFFMPDEFDRNSTGWYYSPDESIRPDEVL